MTGERNFSIDILRLVLCYLVILLHLGFNSQAYMDILLKTAVPSFFMISGYYLISFDGVGKRLLRLSKTLLFSAGFFLAFKLFSHIISGGGYKFNLYLKEYLGSESILEFILFGRLLFAEHLWYIFAIIEVIIIMKLFNSYLSRGRSILIIIVLFSINLLLGTYSMLVFNRDFDTVLVRNAICTGLPFFLLGREIRENLGRYKRHLALLVGLALAVFIAESAFVSGYSITGADLYLSDIIIPMAVLVLALSFEIRHLKTLARLGRRYSLYIYIFHPVLISINAILLSKLGIENTAVMIINSMAVFWGTLLFSIIYVRINEKIFINKGLRN